MTPPPDMGDRFDLAIVGGGTVGSALALLVTAGDPDARVLLVDKGRPPPPHKTFSVTFGSRLVLEETGAWEDIAPRAHAITGAEISLDGSFGMLSLDRSDLGEDDGLCHSVPAADLDRALRDRAAQAPGITPLPGELVRAGNTADGARLTVRREGEEHLAHADAARCVITAGSPETLLRSGFRTWAHDYGQAIVSCVTDDPPANPSLAIERFGPDGIYACVPRVDGCGIVACLKAEEARRAGELDDRELAGRIVPPLGKKVFARLPPIRAREVFPLGLRVAFPAHIGNVCLIGSALQAIHPVGAQGMNLALRDASVLAKLLGEIRVLGDASPDGGLFRRLKRLRAADRRRTVLSTHAIAQVATGGGRLLRDIAGGALMAVSVTRPARRMAARSIFLGRMPV